MTETSHWTRVSASGGDVSVYASRVSVMFSALDNRDSDTVIGHLTDDVVVHLLIAEYRVYVDMSPVFAGTDPGH